MMFNDLETTIAAIATPAGVGGVAVVRLSGPDSWAVTKALMQHPKRLADAGRVVVDWLVDTRDGQVLDQVVLLPFRAPEQLHRPGRRGNPDPRGAGFGAAGTATLLGRRGHVGSCRRVYPSGHGLWQAKPDPDRVGVGSDPCPGERMVKLAAHNMHQRTLAGLLERYWQAIQTIQADMVAHIDFPDEVDEPDRGYCNAV
ncbi:MAG: hypothetical protein R2857_01380 [Vampirovibrionales bacterium]